MDKEEFTTVEDGQEDYMVYGEDAENASMIKAANLNEETEDAAEDAQAYDEYTDEPMPMPEDEAEEAAPAGIRHRPKFFKPFLFIIIVCFCVIAAIDLIAQQNEIEQLEQETVMMAGKIEETKQLNDEYTALLQADEADFMERVAVEQLGYSYPNERRYYIVNKSEDNTEEK
ncbi:MAG: septum formation initiator [Ruminococcus sp.]|nr:septum formation initiator [Ruminococcus sp.]